jgi:arylsulfatase A-like enzyme
MTPQCWRTAALLALAAWASPVGAATPARPNIVVLVADDWGFTDLGAFGGEIATPNLDALALQGLRFSNFHVAASCAPTRSMLLTGVDNHRNGVGNLAETMPSAHHGRPGYQGSLTPNVVTVAQLLQDSGYRTYITGKWNVGSEPYNLPNRRGFDRSIIQGDTGSDNWDPEQRYLPHSAKVDWFEDGKPATMPRSYYSSTYFVDRMLDYWRQDRGRSQPFFSYVAFQANHVPLQAPEAFVKKYRGRYQAGWTALRQERRDHAVALGLLPASTVPVTMASTPDWAALKPADRLHQEREMEVYAAMAEAMDAEVGRLVAYLRQTGEFDNTVFVFLSDNGPEASDYAQAQLWLATQYTQATEKLGGPGAYGIAGPGWASASASPLSGYKFYAGEGGLRTPMFISGPQITRSRDTETALTHVTDIAPTLLQLAQVTLPGAQYKGQAVEEIAGVSLVPLLQGQSQQVRDDHTPLGYELAGSAALFKGGYKLVKNLPPVDDGNWRLYDLRTDPAEAHDLGVSHPELRAELERDYATWASSHGVLDMPPGYNPQTQVLINSIYHYWLPAYGPWLGGLLAFGVLAWGWRRHLKRKGPAR